MRLSCSIGEHLYKRFGQRWQGQDVRKCQRQIESALSDISVIPLAEVFYRLGTRNRGLLCWEAAKRLKAAGPNVLPRAVPPPTCFLFLRGSVNPFNALLAFLAVISAISPSPSWETVSILLIMIIVSSVVRFHQEYQSSVEMFRLQSNSASMVRVRRQVSVNGTFGHHRVHETLVPAAELVTGDIIFIHSGETVPADCRVIDSHHLRVSQAVLSGESVAVRKAPCLSKHSDSYLLLDRENIVFMGSTVACGNAVGIVVATGSRTFMSSIAQALNNKRPPTAFELGVRNIFTMSRRATGSSARAALFAISVAVGLVPEMLPAIVNANLARGALLLLKKCTGTITTDKLTVSHCANAQGIPDMHVFCLAYINAACQLQIADDIDHAVLRARGQYSQPPHIPYYETVEVIPFSFERRRSSCIIRNSANRLVLICKGAYDEVMALCTHVRFGAVHTDLDMSTRERVAHHVRQVTSRGYRVLLIAAKTIEATSLNQGEVHEGLENQMTLEGLIAFSQPVKEDAASSIHQLQDLGVELKILTGDSLEHTLRVFHELRLGHRFEGSAPAISGLQLDEINDPRELDMIVKGTMLFYKLTPGQKGHVVESLRRQGSSVGMLADGVNDCVALRSADVGITVDTAASAAKDSSDVILATKDLRILVDAVTVGRIAHGNTVKYIKMVTSSNFGNVFSVLIASIWLPFEPMTSLQLLFQNLLYDISQIAIAWDSVDEEYLQLPQNWNVSGIAPKLSLNTILIADLH
ncbi:hypothetical protein EYZ11_009741 [Aspergillus tanneri]|uniref:Cation-transporting P-type ATPase N-terminal domain-containing protein n=1 Tax=Aspergillus tanneri TaxID=1220188 RepID=A0A4S3J991_9EURO|nr:hypothetical protein EYZ11_009741 [Aspergillus tanneri]